MNSTGLRSISWTAEYLNVPPRTLYAWVKAGLIPHLRIGRRVFFREDSLEEFLSSGGSPLGNLANQTASLDSDVPLRE